MVRLYIAQRRVHKAGERASMPPLSPVLSYRSQGTEWGRFLERETILRNSTRFGAIRLISALGLVMTAATAAQAENGGLPGGASSLTETHGDWTVSCRIQPQGEGQQAIRLCSLSQQQADAKGQRTLAVELQPTSDGASGALVLPFGLQLSDGVVLQIDEAKGGKPLPFSTCLPGGCLVPVAFDASRVDALAKGKALTILAKATNANEVKLAVSLTGFANALGRTKELLK